MRADGPTIRGESRARGLRFDQADPTNPRLESSPIVAMLKTVAVYLRLIRFSHTVFALPFAIIGAMLAANGWPGPREAVWILVAMVAGRSAAMGFNRWLDADIDAANPRTVDRDLPAGRIGKRAVLAFTVLASALFFLAAGMLNTVALVLSPFVLGILLGYSFTKRFTAGSHFVLGLALGIAPLGAWIAILGEQSLVGIEIPLLLGFAVLLWVAGFDIIYSCMDIEFDRRRRLHSIPSRLGAKRALGLARVSHVGMILLLGVLVVRVGSGPIFAAGIVAVAALLVYEHALVRPDDLSKIDRAFFTVNSIVGLVLLAAVVADLLVFGRVP